MKDIAGVKFHRLTAQNVVGKNKCGQYLWECICECGNRTVVSASDLIRGHIKSCGCMRIDAITKHGSYKTRLYKIWQSMIERCEKTTAKSYKWYGANGIRVCETWHDFAVFKQWAETNGYSDELTLDRIDGTKGYEPSNCRWATTVEQANNKTNNVFIEFEGRRLTISQWAKERGIKVSTLRERLKRGWSIEKALQTLVIGKECPKMKVKT